MCSTLADEADHGSDAVATANSSSPRVPPTATSSVPSIESSYTASENPRTTSNMRSNGSTFSTTRPQITAASQPPTRPQNVPLALCHTRSQHHLQIISPPVHPIPRHTSPEAISSEDSSAVTSHVVIPPFQDTVSFEWLCEELSKARSDHSYYTTLYGRTLFVELQQEGPKTYFNIHKRSKKAQSQGCKDENKSKHEYVMDAKFRGPKRSAMHLCCRLDSAILEPHFPLSASEMRSLNKSNKDKSNELVREGGRLVQVQTQSLNLYEATPFPSPEDFASLKETDPVLFLRKVLNQNQ